MKLKVGVQRLSLICPQEEIQNQLDVATGKEIPEEGTQEEVSNNRSDNIDVNTEKNQDADNFDESIDAVSVYDDMNCEVTEKVVKQRIVVKVDNEGEEAIKDVKK